MRFDAFNMPNLRRNHDKDDDINDPHSSLIKNQRINDTINEDEEEEGIQVVSGDDESETNSYGRSPSGY